MRIHVGDHDISIEQSPPSPAWVRMQIDMFLVSLRPEEFATLVDCLVAFKDHYFKKE